MAEWVDFRQLRQDLDFRKVLAHYGVRLKGERNQQQVFCPLPTHRGERKTPSFSVNLERHIWQCFGSCQCGGNLLEFAVLMDGGNPKIPADVRKTALALQRQFLGDGASRRKSRLAPLVKEAVSQPQQADTASTAGRQVLVNVPMDFELKDLDHGHPYLLDRGFTPETIAHFGLGYCNRGLMKERVVIPLHNPAGKLVGYAGRWAREDGISEKNPKYRFPSDRERNGVIHEFHKSLLLYNAHRIKKPVDDLVVVEGFPSVWWLWQHKFQNVVALMGASCSAEQACLLADLVRPGGCIWVFSDGDDAGDRCAASAFMHVGALRQMRYVPVDRDKQPTDYDAARLRQMLSARR